MVTAFCVRGPDFQRPTAPVPSGWLDSRSHLKTDPVDYGRWWGVFNDATLNALVEEAYKQNLSLQAAAVRILEGRASLAVAKGFRFPQQQAVGGQVAQIGLSENASNRSFVDMAFFDFQAGFDSAWELDTWGRFRRGIAAADAQFLAAVMGYDDALVTITAEVARAYVLLRTFQERLRLARENAGIQRESLRIVQVRFRYGAVGELDVNQARSLLRDTEALVPTLQVGIRQSKNALSVLLGRPPDELSDLLKGPRVIPTPPPEVAVGAPVDLLRRRPDVRQAELLAAAQSERIGIALTDLLPRFSLIGSIGFVASAGGGALSNNSGLDDLFDISSLEYSVGPAFSWPILNYGRLRNRVRVEDARYQQLAILYKQRVLEAAREVQDALTAYLRTGDRVHFLAGSVTDAKRAVEVASVQYRAGAVDYQRVLDTQQFLVQQQDRLTLTRGDVLLNLIAAFKALGGGWQIRQGQRVLPAEIEEEMRNRTNWGRKLSITPPETTQRQPEEPPR